MRRIATIALALVVTGAPGSQTTPPATGHANSGELGLHPTATAASSAPGLASAGSDAARSCQTVVMSAPALGRTEPVSRDRRAVVALVNFADAPNEPFTTQAVDELFFGATDSLAAVTRENSFGSLTLAGEVYGWLTFANRFAYRSDEIDAVVTRLDAEVNWNQVHHLFVVVEGADYTGQASIGRGHVTTPDGGAIMSWAFVSDHGAELSLLVHEFGHNLGLRHASSWDCDPHPVGADLEEPLNGCAIVRYGDGYDPMSAATIRHYSAYNKLLAGLMPPEQSRTVTEGRHVIDALATPSDGVKELRVPIDAEHFYTIEFRSPVGLDATPGDPPDTNPITGVLVRVGLEDPTQSDYGTLRPRLRMPNAVPGEDSIEVLRGAPFSDPYRNLTVRLLSIQGHQAEVELTHDVPTPIVTIKADPPVLSQPGQTRLTWWTPDATGCTASGGWSGSKDTGNGTEVLEINQTTTFALTCQKNRESTTEEVTVPVTGDLIVESLRMTPTRPRVGRRLTFIVDTLNQGRGPTGPTTARLQIDVGGDGGWDIAASQATGILAPFQGGRHRFRLPWNDVGSHRYEICLDPEQVVAETPTGNNCVRGTFSAPAEPDPGAGANSPDLYVASVRTRPSTSEVGQALTWLVIAGNQGNEDATDIQLAAELDIGNDGSVDRTAMVAVQAIGAGRTRGARMSGAWTAAAGTHRLRVCADAADSLVEADEDNNCGELVFTVPG